METERVEYHNGHCQNNYHHSNGGNAVYGLGLIGAAIFYIGQATTFWMGVLGFLKAIVWPVFLVLEALKALA
ncbi:MAG: hypothetical protein H0S79_20235 [Anaerolineaceae bacterium]|nr:hypothetical protein [Anaerolineaceae bacterium]